MRKTNPVPGESVATFLRKNKELSAGARLGVEKKTELGWESVSLRYVLKEGDFIRIRPAKGSTSDSLGLLDMVKSIVRAQRK